MARRTAFVAYRFQAAYGRSWWRQGAVGSTRGVTMRDIIWAVGFCALAWVALVMVAVL